MPTLHWIGKEKVLNHHLDVPFHILETIEGPQSQESTDGGHVHLIKGDNLLALKALIPKYEGKVKCIYIDPPYNTGNEGWVYNDAVNDPKIKRWLGQVVGKEADDLSRHDKWLCMMYPRLKLLHRLLAEDGVIFVSIDDNEQAHLKMVMDEIFGPVNFVDNVIWQKMFAPKNSAKYFSANHDFIIVYAKSKESWVRNPLQRTDEQNSRYSNVDNDERGVWTSGDLSARNPYSLGIYPIETPSGRIIDGPPKGTFWRVSKEKLLQLDSENRIWWGKEGNNVPRLKRFLSEIQEGIVPQTIWLNTDVGNTQDAKKEFNKILDDIELSFDTPKPVKLIERILEIASKSDSIVLDSFAGSGTTAHAVLNLNKKDGGNRQCILVEMEEYAESITAERVKRVIAGYGEGTKAVEGTGGRFQLSELGPKLFHEDGNLNAEVPLNEIRNYVWWSETRSALPIEAFIEGEGSYFLGLHQETAYYFYYEKEAVTTLDEAFLNQIQHKADTYVVYADELMLSENRLRQLGIQFKKIPRDIHLI